MTMTIIMQQPKYLSSYLTETGNANEINAVFGLQFSYSSGNIMQITGDLRKNILTFQQTKITEHYIYNRLVKRINPPENAKILDKIAEVVGY